MMRIVGLPGDRIACADRRLVVKGVDPRGKQLDDLLDDQAGGFVPAHIVVGKAVNIRP